MGGKVLTSLQSMYAADKACVLTRDGPTGLFDCSIGVKQGCPASPLLFNLYLDELEALLEAFEEIDCPRIAGILLAILLSADDIALFSYSHRSLQRLLDILYAFRTDRQLTFNVAKTKALEFEARKKCYAAGGPLSMLEMRLNRLISSSTLGFRCMGKGLAPAMK